MIMLAKLGETFYEGYLEGLSGASMTRALEKYAVKQGIMKYLRRVITKLLGPRTQAVARRSQKALPQFSGKTFRDVPITQDDLRFLFLSPEWTRLTAPRVMERLERTKNLGLIDSSAVELMRSILYK